MAEPGGNKRHGPLRQAPALLGRALGRQPHRAAAVSRIQRCRVQTVKNVTSRPGRFGSANRRDQAQLLPMRQSCDWESLQVKVRYTAGLPTSQSSAYYWSNIYLLEIHPYLEKTNFTWSGLLWTNHISYACVCRIRALLSHMA